MTDLNSNVLTASSYQKERIAHWDCVARKTNDLNWAGANYQKMLAHYYGLMIPKGASILEIGCGSGNLLASLNPLVGVGIDFSIEMINRAKQKYPNLRFILDDANELSLDEKFDFIILSDLVNDLWDVQAVFERLEKLIHPRTRLIINTFSRIWEIPLKIAQRFGLSRPTLEQNWLTVEDIISLLRLENFEVISYRREILFPLSIPIITEIANRFLAKIWPFSHVALTNFIIAHPINLRILKETKESPSVSVIVPARNEAENIEGIFVRTPEMGFGTELVFVEGHSTDQTYKIIEQLHNKYPTRRCKIYKQTGKGKGDAVRLGFTHASGDILMILDADVTVQPEDLPRFYEVLVSGKGDFVNGVRLVYPMEKEAMRFINKIGNKLFGLSISWLLGQPIKDTLCGTKALWKHDYDLISANREYFGNFDPFGDFDLLFGAAKLLLKIVDLPIRYRERTYGSTNINRWKHGWLLLKMLWFSARRIKFV